MSPDASPPAPPTGAPATAGATAPASGRELTAASPGLERRAGLLLVLLLALLAGATLYLLYARGAFDATQKLTLVADDSEGVSVGMDMTFSGFPIGRVSRITLGADGTARIQVEVPRDDARWLRQSSIFTLTRSLVGGTAIKAYSGILTDPPLPDGAERPVLVGDATAEVPRLVAAIKDLVGNLTALTAGDAALASTLGNLQTTTQQLNGPSGALGVLMGSADNAAKITTALDRSNALLARLDGLVNRTQGVMGKADGLVGRVDGLVARADERVLGQGGLMDDTQGAVRTLRSLLDDARGTLQSVDKLLVDAQAITGQAKVATEDLGALRAEVDASLRRVQHLVNEVNKRWPFASDTTIRLP